MKYLLAIITIISTFHLVDAQEDRHLVNDMSALQFMVGTWEGEGWILNNKGEKKYFRQTEIIKSKVNGQVLVIDGMGYELIDSIPTDRAIHDVVGIVSIHPEKGSATMYSILEKQGRSEVEIYKLKDKNAIQWSIVNPNSDTEVRFTEDLSIENEWNGRGEVLTKDGRWYKFFEMSLIKQ